MLWFCLGNANKRTSVKIAKCSAPSKRAKWIDVRTPKNGKQPWHFSPCEMSLIFSHVLWLFRSAIMNFLRVQKQDHSVLASNHLRPPWDVYFASVVASNVSYSRKSLWIENHWIPEAACQFRNPFTKASSSHFILTCFFHFRVKFLKFFHEVFHAFIFLYQIWYNFNLWFLLRIHRSASDQLRYHAKTGLSSFHSRAAVPSGSFNCTWWHDWSRTHGCPKVHAVLLGFLQPATFDHQRVTKVYIAFMVCPASMFSVLKSDADQDGSRMKPAHGKLPKFSGRMLAAVKWA